MSARWENAAVEPDKMTLKDFLYYLTDNNWHSERCLVETIIDGREDLIIRACKIVLKHYEDGYLTDENWQERKNIYEELRKED